MIHFDTIEGIVKKYYDVEETENTRYSIVFHIGSRENEKTFSHMLDELKTIGATAFTNDFPDNQIIVISNNKIRKERNGLKALMFFITMVTLIYTGFVYYSAYSSSNLIYRNILYGTLLYAFPVTFILLFRESGKYLALRKNHVKYNFPIFIPSPGIGTLGTMNSNKNQFRTSKSMIDTGVFSLLFGFFASVLLIIIGAVTMPYVQYSASIHSPISVLNFPLIFPLVFDHLFPAFLIPDPLELAGYVGIVTTALNAMPVGFMDGGLVFSGILGKHFKYVSYAGIAVLLASSIIYPYILILAGMSFLLGIRGALPMNNFFKPRATAKWAALIMVVIIVLIGFAPLPLHNSNTSNVTIPNSSYIIQQNGTGNITVNVTVQNHNINILPIFSVAPGNFTVKGFIKDNNTATTYIIELITYRANYSGRQNFTITVNTGTGIFHKTVSVYFLKADKNIYINNINRKTITEYVGVPFNISITNNGTTTLDAQIISIFNGTDIYMVSPPGYSGVMINLSFYSSPGIILVIPGGHYKILGFEAYKPGNLKLVVMEHGGEAAVVDIHIVQNQHKIISPPGPFAVTNYTENYYFSLSTIHSFYNFR